MSEKYIDFFIRNNKKILIGMIILHLFIFSGLFFIKIDNNDFVYTLDNSPSKINYNKMNTYFKNNEQLIYVVNLENYSQSPEDFIKIYEIDNIIMHIKDIAYVFSPVVKNLFIDKAESAEDRQKTVTKIIEFNNALGDLSPLVLFEGNYFAVYTVFLKEKSDYCNIIKKIDSLLNEKKIKYYVSGELYLKKKLQDYIFIVSMILPPIALLLMMLLFFLILGSFKAAVISFIPTVAGTLWLVSLMGFLNIKLTILSSLSPLFVLIIGSANGLHIVSHYIKESKNQSKKAALTNTYSVLTYPIFLTTIMTILGFLAMLSIDSQGIRGLIILSSLGVIFTTLTIWLMMPVVFINTNEYRSNPIILKNMNLLKSLWGYKIGIITFSFLLIASAGFFMLNKNFTILSIFNKNTDLFKNIINVDKICKGSLPVFILAESAEDPVSFDIGMKIINLENELSTEGLILKSYSIHKIIGEINKKMTKDYKIMYPDHRVTASFIYTYLSVNLKEITANLINKKEKISRIMVFPIDFKNDTLEKISNITANYNSDLIKFFPAGVQYSIKDINDSFLKNLMISLFIDYFLVFTILIIAYWKMISRYSKKASIKAGKSAYGFFNTLWIFIKKFFESALVSLISILPITVTLAILFGVIGFMQIPLSIFSVLMVSITIGIGMDYSIHYTVLFLNYRKKQVISDIVCDHAYQDSFRPVLSDSLGLAIGFSCLFLSPMNHHVQFSILMSIVMIVSSFLSLTLLPTLLKIFGDYSG